MISEKYTLSGCLEINNSRLNLSFYKNTANAKTKRKLNKARKYKKDDKTEEKEGQMYVLGGF